MTVTLIVWGVCRVVSHLCVGSQCVCTCVLLTTETHCVTMEWGVAGKWDAEALRAFVFIQNSISHLLPAGRESVQYLFCSCFTLNL